MYSLLLQVWKGYRTVNMVNEVSNDKEALCYLCLDGGVDDAGQPLRRDCACRGTDAGFVHLSCLAEYLSRKSERWDGRDMNEFRKPWWCCPSCHQYYQNELAIDIATEFVSFVRRQYPDDTRMQVEALNVKLRAFDSMLWRLQPVQKVESGVTANVQLSLIDQMRKDSPRVSMRYSEIEANAHGVHGRIAFAEGTDESARRAVSHFEKYLAVNEAIGNVDGIAHAKANIALAKSKYEGGNNKEELLRASRELYELRVAKSGENNRYTIIAGRSYAINLHKANRGDEARALLTKLLITSKQVLGPHHNVTKDVELLLESIIRKENRFMK